MYGSKIYDGVSSNTNLFFIVALKISGFFLICSSIFKIIFHNFGACIVILYVLFVSLMAGTIQLFRELGNDVKALRI